MSKIPTPRAVAGRKPPLWSGRPLNRFGSPLGAQRRPSGNWCPNRRKTERVFCQEPDENRASFSTRCGIVLLKITSPIVLPIAPVLAYTVVR